MKTEAIFMGSLIVLAVVLSLARRKPDMPLENFISYKKPTLWWFVDSEPNARNWWDFGARTSEEPNRGYLAIALEAVRRTQSQDFAIVPLIGRDATLRMLTNPPSSAKQLPPALWRSFVMSSLLNQQGGLVMDGNSTLCVGPSLYPHVKDVEAAAFGVHPAEPVANPDLAVAPGPAPYVAWAAKSHHPAWAAAAHTWTTLVEAGPQAWSSAVARRTELKVWEIQKTQGLQTIRGIDGTRLQSGLPRQLEDLVGRVSVPPDPKIALSPETVFVSYDGDDLARRFELNWFLRLSPDQIKSSDLVWAQYAGY